MAGLTTMRGFIVFIILFCLGTPVVSSDHQVPPEKDSESVSIAWELPPLVLSDLNGRKRNLYDWHGRIIILNFWATWYAPCQIEIPHLIRYQNDYADAGLQVIGVGLDNERKLKDFARTLAINYPVLSADPYHDIHLLRLWGDDAGVLPFTVVIDRNGHLVYMQQGVFDQEAFLAYVKPLFDPAGRNDSGKDE